MKVSVSRLPEVLARRESRRPVMVALICLGLFLALMFRFSGLAYGSMGYLGLPITLLSMTAQVMTGWKSPLDCYYDESESMVSMGNVSRCVVMPIAQIAGGLCVTFSSFCSEQSVQEWTEEFMQRNEGATDVFVDESSVTLLGQDKDVSWRVRALADEFDEEQTRILFSALRKGSHLSEDQINALGFAAMRQAVNEQLRIRQAGVQTDPSDDIPPDWLDNDDFPARDPSERAHPESQAMLPKSANTEPVGGRELDYEQPHAEISHIRARSSGKSGKPPSPLKRYREGS